MTDRRRRPGGDLPPPKLRHWGERGGLARRHDEAGAALALAVGVMFLVVILGLTAVSQTTTAIFQSRNTYTQVVKNLANEAPQLFLNGKTASVGGATSPQCASAGSGSPAIAFATNTKECTSGVTPSGVATGLASGMATTTAATATTTLTTGPASASSTTVSLSGCGVAQIWATAGTDTGLLYGGGTYGTPFAPLNSNAMTFNGSDAWGETIKNIAAPMTYTLTGWFKATGSGPSASGSIIGFSNVQGTANQTASDRLLWLDSTGHLVFEAYNSRPNYITSSATYTDGNWHFVAITVSGSGGTMYVDGASTPAQTSSAMNASLAYNGYWHLGFSNANQLLAADGPSSGYFNGSLAQLAEFPTALSAAAITALYAVSGMAAGVPYVASAPTNFNNAAIYTAQETADGAGDVWAMSENGATPYTAQPPGVAKPLCNQVELTLEGSFNGSPPVCLLGTLPCRMSSAVTFANFAAPAAPWSYLYSRALSTAVLTMSVVLVGAPPIGSVGLHVVSSFAVVCTAVGAGGATVTAQLLYGQTGAEL